MTSCAFCTGPVTGAGHAGRPWPGRAAATYCCFGCLSLGEQRQQEAASPSSRATDWTLDSLGVRLAIGILVVGQSMIFGLALNLHDDVPADVRWFAQTLILGATLLVAAFLGGPLASAAWRELRRGQLTIEALFLLTMTGAMAASFHSYLTGRGPIYFEVVSVLLVVYTFGKVIGARSRAAALAGSRAWAGQLDTCRLIDERGRTRVVRVTDVLPGDVIEVNPGETIAVDGAIRAGIGFVSEAAVSGEPFAVVRRPGDRVLAGAASHDAAFQIEATAPGIDRQIDRLLAAVEEAHARPVSLQAQADRVGRWFLPLVVFTALGTFGYWAFLTHAGFETALFNAMSVLLVACPCAIGLATPVVIWSALGRLAERGVIVRSGDAVERLAAVDRVMLDKTGTLTDDSFALLDIATTATGPARAKLLGWLSVVQERSNHPVARPFAALPRPFAPEDAPRIVSLTAVPGCGVEAEIETEGVQHALRIGTPEWIFVLASAGRQPPESSLDAELKATGHLIHVALDGELVAVAVLAEHLRDSARDALAGFRRLGLPVEVLTGDSAARAAALDLPATRAGLLPDEKRAAVAAGGKPLFVGDGINDAAALAAAHAGIALSSGTDLAVGAADVTLYHTDLRVIPWAVELSREAVRSVRSNMFRALAYNLIGMTLAACGLLHPVIAAVLMVVSSLSLIFASTRLGVVPDHCRAEVSVERQPSENAESEESQLRGLTPPARRGVVHALALAFQGVVFLLLLDSARELPLVLGGFAAAGVALGSLWYRWSAIPHRLDMCVGMLTLGNLGMLLGWWADAGFAPLHCAACCSCADPLGRPWMWVGMLVFANGAMLGFARRPATHGRDHTLAMYTGGNVGMLAGMFAGGVIAQQAATESTAIAAIASFVGMTAGMLAGMLCGTWLTERAASSVRLIPHFATWIAKNRPERPQTAVPGLSDVTRTGG